MFLHHSFSHVYTERVLDKPRGFDEATWYATPQGRRKTQRELARALKDGTLERSPGSKIARTDPKLLRQLAEQAARKP
jgi:hypothetical protein